MSQIELVGIQTEAPFGDMPSLLGGDDSPSHNMPEDTFNPYEAFSSCFDTSYELEWAARDQMNAVNIGPITDSSYTQEDGTIITRTEIEGTQNGITLREVITEAQQIDGSYSVVTQAWVNGQYGGTVIITCTDPTYATVQAYTGDGTLVNNMRIVP